MNACSESPSTTTMSVISDLETLTRVLKEIVEIQHLAIQYSMSPRSLRLLSQAQLRVTFLLLNLCSNQLGHQDWVSIHSLQTRLRAQLGPALNLGG